MKKTILIKNKKDIDWVRKAWYLSAWCLDYIGQFVKPWITTLELDDLCNDFILKNWWKSACIGYHWYPRYTCISVNEVVCHWIPSKSIRLKEWDIVNIDVTSIVNWYFWDTSRMYRVWKIKPVADKLCKDTLKALEIWIAQVKPWNNFWNIGYEIAKFAKSRWYWVVKDFGWHWVWIEFHEEPFISHDAPKNSWDIMKPWMIFTIEPMINEGTNRFFEMPDWWTIKTKDKKLSAQYEHTILVTQDWYEILTPWNTWTYKTKIEN